MTQYLNEGCYLKRVPAAGREANEKGDDTPYNSKVSTARATINSVKGKAEDEESVPMVSMMMIRKKKEEKKKKKKKKKQMDFKKDAKALRDSVTNVEEKAVRQFGQIENRNSIWISLPFQNPLCVFLG